MYLCKMVHGLVVSIHFIVDKPGFNSLVESDQKTLKVGFHCLMFSIKGLV